MRYIGGKNGDGTFQRIINLIPPHRVYIEPFLGSGAILRLKSPALVSYGVDRIAPDPALLQVCNFRQGCGIEFLENYRFDGNEFVYCDPPYLLETRRFRRYYAHEMTDDDHQRLLAVIRMIPAEVMISGYPSRMYDEALADWRRVEFTAYTRQHEQRTEVLWMNYEAPDVLHDHAFVGQDYRERWRIEKRRRRWSSRIGRLSAHERAALFSALVDAIGHETAQTIISGAAGSRNAVYGGGAGTNAESGVASSRGP